MDVPDQSFDVSHSKLGRSLSSQLSKSPGRSTIVCPKSPHFMTTSIGLATTAERV